MPDQLEILQKKYRYEGILAELGKVVGKYSFDLLFYTPHELEAISNRHFIFSALQEGKVIYESKQASS
jgi:hypothetical protein